MGCAVVSPAALAAREGAMDREGACTIEYFDVDRRGGKAETKGESKRARHKCRPDRS
jgi:hypothetical protein